MDLVRSYFGTNEPAAHFFPHFLTGLLCDQSKVKKKVLNWPEVHLQQCKFLQNPYFKV